ncbi:trans-2,3-dihydro-3-hydroxyanthranilate isomerase [Granulicella pectinivorans]|jgi:trans-2,3-dihydro-3-hydroxyanthranilate isomerase|uniref:Trans-2,3-dihydro-3-hydroxyanthranilate isomerase n=1 Tax=Granulicella pectinivorans TaxID=474950 RepID=A0A1I6L068_9BACT|nr:PhzF family phenazine biosynthesis protein [Granulicella pectinivorans]SFR96638.1 trans-2,3-dihydro-3-hydroxyanthranilate isomerase [Granulicella pectinivorans]
MSTPRTLDYTQVDVFAERPLEGNMLAIFHDATGLTTAEMQALARETNLSETTFILPRDEATERAQGVRVRIFTTEEELRFAGHPTLGTASWIHEHHPIFRNAETITLELGVGQVPVRFDPSDPARPGVFGTMHQPNPTFGAVHDPAAVAAAIGLTAADLDPTLPIQTVSTGMAFCIVPLRSLEVARRLKIPQGKAQPYLDASDAKFFHCITRTEQGSRAQWHARMQFYNGEDPATGSASGCTIAFLVQHGAAPSGELTLLEQGIEMLRPSEIHTRATLLNGAVTKVFVGGRTIPVATGRFFLP